MKIAVVGATGMVGQVRLKAWKKQIEEPVQVSVSVIIR
jgi:aspartate-semialdehyde dehydrogenase